MDSNRGIPFTSSCHIDAGRTHSFCGSFTKVILEAKNKYQLEKVYTIANELGLKEGIDYFSIKDNCYTELEPEETDEDGIGRTLTCVGFIPLNDEIANKISKRYQLYKD